ncbi:MAG: phosphatase PAP2 family protein [Alphaproteobacteria bacterium]|nr:phosphatase PAP2 family protein [Alphaproteobacteria bacterium]
MIITPLNALLVLLYGLAAGVALWVTGVDVGLQVWLYANYDQTFNDQMRWLSTLALGRNQVFGLLAVGLSTALWVGGCRGVWRALQVSGEQMLAWARGQRGWLAGWHAQPVLARLTLTALPVLAVAGVVQVILKFLIGRPRPKELLWNGTDPFSPHPFSLDSSFWALPSGHTTSTFAIFTWLMLGLPRWRVPLLMAAMVLSASRFLAVTPHYLGDVVAGAGVGAACALWLWSRTQHAR